MSGNAIIDDLINDITGDDADSLSVPTLIGSSISAADSENNEENSSAFEPRIENISADDQASLADPDGKRNEISQTDQKVKLL